MAVKVVRSSPLWHSDQVVRINSTQLGKLISRHAEAYVTEALTDTRVVLVTGCLALALAQVAERGLRLPPGLAVREVP